MGAWLQSARGSAAVALSALLGGCEPAGSAGPRSEERVREPRGQAAPQVVDLSPGAVARLAPRLHHGQELYLPVYSSVFAQDEERPLHLTVTVSVHNTGSTPVVLTRVDYIGTRGNLLETVLQKPVVVGPLETREYVVRERDIRGGTGASFIVSWNAEEPTTAPVVQAVNISSSGNHTFGFVTRAVVLKEKRSDD